LKKGDVSGWLVIAKQYRKGYCKHST